VRSLRVRSLAVRFPTETTSRPFHLAEREAFEEIQVDIEGDTAVLRYAREDSYWQLVALGVSTFLFMLFVVTVMPLMQLTAWGNAFWIVVGVAVLGLIGFGTQAVLKETIIRLNNEGIEITQGNAVDREAASLRWENLRAAELEPVDAKDGRKGMTVVLTLNEGEPIKLLGGVGVGDLNRVRRIFVAELNRRAALSHQPTPSAEPNVGETGNG
jgi:hypothetical protein